MIAESPLEFIFRDLFYHVNRFANGHDLFLKLEGFNVTGSIKVKTAIGLLEDLERRGLAIPGETVIIESSSGNLGVALSMVCAIKGYRFVCVTDANATRSNIRSMELYGAKVVVIKDRDSSGGFLEGRFEAINHLLATEPNSVWLNQYDNVANTNLHAMQTANEIATAFQRVDWVFVGAGTTGTLGGISQRLREVYPGIKVIGVDPRGSVTFGGPPEKRTIPGIGASIRPKIADYAKADKIVMIDEVDTVASCLNFVRDHHLLVGGSTGSVLAAVTQLSPQFKPDDVVVAISADLGEKYLDTVYDPDWVAQNVACNVKEMAEL